jgi:cation transporter-like permease
MTDHDIIYLADRRARLERNNTDRAIGRVVICAAGAVGIYIVGSVIAALVAYAMGWV